MQQAIGRSPSGRGGQQPANSRELSRQGSLSNMSNPLSRTDVANTSMPSAVKSGKKSQRFGAFSLPVSHAQAESFVSSRSERSSSSILGWFFFVLELCEAVWVFFATLFSDTTIFLCPRTRKILSRAFRLPRT